MLALVSQSCSHLSRSVLQPTHSRAPRNTLKPAVAVIVVAAAAVTVAAAFVVVVKSTNAGSKGSISLSHAVSDVASCWRYQHLLNEGA